MFKLFFFHSRFCLSFQIRLFIPDFYFDAMITRVCGKGYKNEGNFLKKVQYKIKSGVIKENICCKYFVVK